MPIKKQIMKDERIKKLIYGLRMIVQHPLLYILMSIIYNNPTSAQPFYVIYRIIILIINIIINIHEKLDGDFLHASYARIFFI